MCEVVSQSVALASLDFTVLNRLPSNSQRSVSLLPKYWTSGMHHPAQVPVTLSNVLRCVGWARDL